MNYSTKSKKPNARRTNPGGGDALILVVGLFFSVLALAAYVSPYVQPGGK
jgi:hypothetical protein